MARIASLFDLCAQLIANAIVDQPVDQIIAMVPVHTTIPGLYAILKYLLSTHPLELLNVEGIGHLWASVEALHFCRPRAGQRVIPTSQIDHCNHQDLITESVVVY